MAAGAHPSPATGSTSDGRCVPDDGMRQSTGLTLPAVLGWCSVSVRRRGTLVHGRRRDAPSDRYIIRMWTKLRPGASTAQVGRRCSAAPSPCRG
jgi:hypothetical protein